VTTHTSRHTAYAITVHWTTPLGERRARLTSTFCIGCDTHGDLQVDDLLINRAHAAVFLRDRLWWVRDLGSSDGGLLLDGVRVQSAPISGRSTLQFGKPALQVTLEVEDVTAQEPSSPAVAVPPSDADSRTRLHPSVARPDASPPNVTVTPAIRIRVDAEPAGREFTETVRVGRGTDCTIRIDDEGVSRVHTELYRAGARWCARDLGSSNGTYLDGVRIEDAPLPARGTLRLGIDGPRLELSYAAPAVVQPAGAPTPRSIEEVAAHYFDPNSKAPAGDRTMWVRRAYSTVQKKQKRKYGSIIAGAVALLFVAVGIGIYQYVQLQRTRGLAEQVFYNMKTIELQLADLETQVQQTADAAQLGEVQQGRAKLAEMSTQYDALLEELGVLNADMPAEDRLILRMAREFGECEIAMPPDFVKEVKRHIEVWRADERLAKALRRAHEQNLPPVIAKAMAERHIPPQFFYVALQESDFKPQAVGPTTRFGIAKGIWQLMPETAIQYGLRTGPLLDVAKFDPADQRFDTAAATQAAARYLGDLYRDEAQASGLLVLASYNWGTTRVRKRILAMKENPRDRNFWRLLAQTDMPKETRDYVLKIFAAAVIGEDPKLFGFDFDKPLAISPPAS
jgi:membrane-bound lytic murein transglycosylase D